MMMSPGSKDLDPELTEAVERERRGNTGTTSQRAGHMDSHVREDIDDPIFDPSDTTWAEEILDEDEPRDPEFKVPAERPRESSSKGKQPEIVEDTKEQFEPARYSKSNIRPVSLRMVKPPPSLRRTVSGIYMTERANVTARDGPAIEKMKQMYERRTPWEKRLYTKMQEVAQPSEPTKKKKESKTARRMYGWVREPEFQFQPLPASNSYGSISSSHARGSYSDYGFQSTQQHFTPRGIQRGMNELATSLFGYSEYSEYKNPLYGFQGQQPYDEGEAFCGYLPDRCYVELPAFLGWDPLLESLSCRLPWGSVNLLGGRDCGDVLVPRRDRLALVESYAQVPDKNSLARVGSCHLGLCALAALMLPPLCGDGYAKDYRENSALDMARLDTPNNNKL
ncbi:hypothetical protein Taro_021547 [Colocasia esculenta]|uniref:Uncharacterized protein n=1 Tax=Colocasia esculenta TaxID=4460 RepID=A0A843UZA1_COLES|nr:hypothetical protein [Colocasia esculenta]